MSRHSSFGQPPVNRIQVTREGEKLLVAAPVTQPVDVMNSGDVGAVRIQPSPECVSRPVFGRQDQRVASRARRALRPSQVTDSGVMASYGRVMSRSVGVEFADDGMLTGVFFVASRLTKSAITRLTSSCGYGGVHLSADASDSIKSRPSVHLGGGITQQALQSEAAR